MSIAATAVASAPYPIDVSVDYPDRPLDRLSTAFRLFYAIPILILLSAVGGGYLAVGSSTTYAAAGGAGGMLFAGPLLMIVFRQKYPQWWFDWNLAWTRFSTRVTVYLALMDDRYPSTDDQQSVRLSLPCPDPPRETEPVAAAGQVAAGRAALRCAGRFVDRRRVRGHRGMVRDPVHRTLPAGSVSLRRRRPPLRHPRPRIRVHARHR
jgi:hypothetical protein